ncbi:MAG: DUF87 domain-containing protein [Gemmatimonadaceae bacterium]
MTNFELLGSLYLGKKYDITARKRSEDYVLYDSKDLTTHAVIIGMTGSGKTGLGLTIIEEALIDKIPVIAVDPKGDLGNLALQFPNLAPDNFRPWVDAQQAEAAGMDLDAYAAQQAKLWTDGLASWGEDGARIQKLRDSAEVSIYTPGSTAGRQVSIMQAFSAPPAALRDDTEAYQEKIEATATGVLALLGIEGDPISSREHILLSNLLSNAWNDGKDLDLASLISLIQTPPFTTIGVMPLDSVFPPKDRLALAMKLNNLLASPGFQLWMQGEPLNTGNLLHDANGKPRCSVMSIAHLNDEQRMFFMTLLLADILAWIRTQPGTSSLRAILYIDELFGYMPPVANPSSKILLLTLLKQARAFGLGVVLSTQNPVDLDYKGLSNAGTWFIGRLQTERDKARVMEGLEGAANGAAFDRDAMEKTIAGLGKRVFLMHSVHEAAPVTFETRWTMSYLAGPMTREQIKIVTKASGAPAAASGPTTGATTARAAASTTSAASSSSSNTRAPVLPPEVPQYFIPPASATAIVSYRPAILAVADVTYASAKYSITEQRRVTLLTTLDDGPIAMDWGTGERVDIDPNALEREPRPGATFDDVPRLAASAKSYPVWSKALQKWITANEVVTLYRSSSAKTISNVGENERDFRIRLQVGSRELRDKSSESLRTKYAPKMSALQERIRKAQQSVEREQQESSQAKMATMVSVGSAILGAFLGRGKIGVGTISKVSTAARSAGRVMKQGGDVTRAGETVEALQQQSADLEAQLQAEVDALAASFDSQAEQFEEITVKAKAGDVSIPLIALAWRP